jgi:hypothetical protein
MQAAKVNMNRVIGVGHGAFPLVDTMATTSVCVSSNGATYI